MDFHENLFGGNRRHTCGRADNYDVDNSYVPHANKHKKKLTNICNKLYKAILISAGGEDTVALTERE